MADLENLLLEAAGRTRHSRPTSRRGHGDGENISSSDDEHEYSGPNLSGSRVPLKKRFDLKERYDGKGSQEEKDGQSDHNGDSSDEYDFGDDLYKNEDDRRKLSEMTELQREMILSDRATKKYDKDLLGKISSKREKGKTTLPGTHTSSPPPSRVRSSVRSVDRSTAKDGALNELRAKRLKQQDSEANRRLNEASKSPGPGHLSPKHKPFSSTSLTSSSDSESENRSLSDDGGLSHDDIIVDSDNDRIVLRSEGLSFEDIKEITVCRSKLAKWFMEPFFEELIAGCFVRVGIGRSKSGPIYRLCLVKNVDATDCDRQYKLENKMTHKYLNLVWGNETSAARWQMTMVSDSLPLEEEFIQWVKEVERRGGRMPTKQEVEIKKQAIQNINSFVYSAATVKQMLQEKKSAKIRPLNIAAEKDRLRTQLEIAQSKQNNTEVNRIITRLQELEEAQQSKEKDARALKLSEMNKKNRFENFKNASELKPMNKDLKAGEAGYDPFSRRWTRSRNYYAAKPTEEAAAEDNSVIDMVADEGSYQTRTAVTGVAGMAATAAAIKAAAGAGKLVDTSAPVDQGTVSNVLHDFELPISLSVLHNFGGAQGVQAGFMAKKQRIEATVGPQVPEKDGKSHAKTISISEYKRRMGVFLNSA
ncbi:protein RTF1 homolog [Vigna radiata var. radiata]|uniref:Protein RTF1 homolog n=1 Tax=Vigna radiata var. radiata TaxID=3916 RepID=A0A1S3TMK1_VIGRR|nr:protein RTF1 homolog [Vigna radiata var. radiata]